MKNGQNVAILDSPQPFSSVAASPPPDGRGSVDDLVRGLVEEARRQQPQVPAGAACPGADEESEVLLDVEVDSVRCVLIRNRSRNPRVTLSPREQEIARMVAKGYTNKTIAAVLDISTWTVCTHLRRSFIKLDVGSRAALVARLFGTEQTVDRATALRSDAGHLSRRAARSHGVG